MTHFKVVDKGRRQEIAFLSSTQLYCKRNITAGMQLVHVACFVLVAVFADSVLSDTPANCSYVDIQGKWMLMEGDRGFDSTIEGCDKEGLCK